MVKEAPSAGRMAAMIAFALSCVAILLYLWLVFGGSVPLRPEGYRFEVKFPEATQLAQEADVRISGVNVGKVKKKEPDRETGLTNTVLELDDEVRADPRRHEGDPAPEDPAGRDLRGAHAGRPQRQAAGRRRDAGLRPGRRPTVELDEIFRTFDPRTREAFSTWLAEQGAAVGEGGQALNDALGSLAPFAEDVGDTLRILDEQDVATRGVVRDTGAVFEALSERQGQLRGLVQQLQPRLPGHGGAQPRAGRCVRGPPDLPTRDARPPRAGCRSSRADTDPLVSQLRPFARQFSPTLVQLKGLAPDLKGADEGPRSARQRLPRPASRRSSARWTTRGRCSPGSIPSCATSSRCSTTSVSTSARSRRSSPTARPPPTATDPSVDRAAAAELPAYHQPAEPRGARGLRRAHRHQPLESLLRARAPSPSSRAACPCSASYLCPPAGAPDAEARAHRPEPRSRAARADPALRLHADGATRPRRRAAPRRRSDAWRASPGVFRSCVRSTRSSLS